VVLQEYKCMKGHAGTFWDIKEMQGIQAKGINGKTGEYK
jgi:hypothetical protein